MKETELWISLAAVVVALLLMSLRRARDDNGKPKSPFGRDGWTRIRLTAGADNRDSTSKTVVLGWTVITAWVVIACVLKSEGTEVTFSALMKGLGVSYFAVLGGPVLAAFLAKAVADSKTSGDEPSLQKTQAAQPALGDLVTADDGGLSVADAQYVLLNLCAAAYVVYAFAKHPDLGVPDFPEQLALLTGGSAATYAGTKGWTANAPRITAMTPTRVGAGGAISVSIRGTNLVSPGRAVKVTTPQSNSADFTVVSSESATIVTIGGWQVPAGKVRARSEEIVITELPTEIASAAGGYDVSVVTAAGLTATAPQQLTVA